jgi:hypothetical protein
MDNLVTLRVYLLFPGSDWKYASLSGISVTTTKYNKPEGIERIFSALCHNRFIKMWNITRMISFKR